MTNRLNHPQIYVNLPVADLEAAKTFYTALGWEVVEEYSNEKAAALQLSEGIFLMVLTREFFATFNNRETATAETPREVSNAVTVDTRADVDEIIRRGREAGADVYHEPAEGDGMYYGAFEDPDGHAWEFLANN